MKHIAAIWARAGAVAALGAALLGAPAAAFAADPLPDLAVALDRGNVGGVDHSGTTVGMSVHNSGQAAATAVSLTVDLSDVGAAVEYSVPERTDRCRLAGTTITCAIGRLEAGRGDSIQPLSLVSKTGAAPGDAGAVTVTVDGAEGDAKPGDDTVSFPVTVLASGPDLVALAADLNSPADRVGPGDTVPLHSAVVNEGDTATSSIVFTVDVRTGATFAERYSDCTYTGYWPGATGQGYVYGPEQVTCEAELALQPGERLLLADEDGRSLFNITFGKNLAGPEQYSGSFQVAQGADVRAGNGAATTGGTGPSFADALRRSRAAGEKAGPAAIQAREPDESDNYRSFAYWSKANKLDVAVSVPAVEASVGDTVDLRYRVVNNGPSDGGDLRVVITAPSGTVLLPAEWCWTDGTDHEQRAESARLRCNFETIFPTSASGYGGLNGLVRVEVKATPGANGTIVADGAMSSTEYKPANNTATIVINTGGGTGGGLPITGAPAALLAGAGAAVTALGLGLLVATRRAAVPHCGSQ